MDLDLRGRSLLKDTDLTAAEVTGLLDLAADLKAAGRRRRPRLAGRSIALIFEKTSTRTRCAFEVAAAHQGAHTTYLGPDGSQLGHKESVADTGAVLGRMYDAIEFRGYSQAAVEELAATSGVPVYNGLTDDYHPTQALCDLFTLREATGKPLSEISVAYLGDTRNNVGTSLLLTGALCGLDVRMAAPPALWPHEPVQAEARALAAGSGGRVTVTTDRDEALAGVDAVYTDVWVSMGEPSSVWAERIELLSPYQVNAGALAATGNPQVKFLHCLPAYHDRQTRVGEAVFEQFGLDGLEVTDEVFRSPASVVFDQAENRLHTTEALLVATLAD